MGGAGGGGAAGGGMSGSGGGMKKKTQIQGGLGGGLGLKGELPMGQHSRASGNPGMIVGGVLGAGARVGIEDPR
jgi:hypothetical protein